MRPVIGITCSFEQRQGAAPKLRAYLNAAYSDAVYAAGGLPFPIAPPPRPDEDLLRDVLARCDGVLFTGGDDVDPRRYGQTPHPRTGVMHPRRDAFEFAFFRLAAAESRPVLSICLGCQVANVACGGKLVQHVDDARPPDGPPGSEPNRDRKAAGFDPRRTPTGPPRVEHYKPDHSAAFHPVKVLPDSHLAEIVGRTEFEVNSRHHQIVDRDSIGGTLRAVAFAPDGVVEALEDFDGRWLLAVQWHPEDMIDRREHLRLFQALVEAAAQRRHAM